jgi:hypothetical protein
MRTTLLLIGVILLPGCPGTAPQDRGQVHIFQPDSPILVGDGSSIHFRKDNGISPVGSANKEIKMQIDPTQPTDIRVYGCTGTTMPAGCTVHYVLLGNGSTSWTADLYHTDGTLAAIVSFGGDNAYVHVAIQPADSTFSADASSGGTHFIMSNYHLGYAMVGGQKLGCPPPPNGTAAGQTACEMAIEPH